ncbi:MAG: thiamine pyrophosphate-dependent dehydrogenase E1 component subunit alpha [Chloroflexota bacterium]|nr:MAG: thiamine pyrophosphate-dependent dehydrogenase E1 component subunit alpha [Chloroflexota bacterium]
MEIARDKLIELYAQMLTIRLFEERARQLYAEGLIPGFVHLYIGQEACATGVCAALRPSDYITSNHRGHGHCIAKGADLRRMMAELLGRKTGYGGGRSGSMHICDPQIGILGANGIVGAGLPIATGAAFSSKLREREEVAVCFFGEGASSEGTFHESLNMAAIWKLPIVYVCENNKYAEMTPQSTHMSVGRVVDRAAAYGIPAILVDGNDVTAVYQATSEAVDRARNGQGPSLLELSTYRWRGHYEGDAEVYRSKEEVSEWKLRCPIEHFRTRLIKEVGLNDSEITAIDERVTACVEDAVIFAIESPMPDPDDILVGVYSA